MIVNLKLREGSFPSLVGASERVRGQLDAVHGCFEF